MYFRRLLIALFASIVSLPVVAGKFFEVDGVALRGYDPVAYFVEGKPVKGLSVHSYRYRDSLFQFSSAENQQKFAADPAKYAPQFGGFCALGTANGYKVKTEPDAFKVVGGRLYFNYNRKVLALWTQDESGYIKRGNENWPEVSQQPMKE